MRLIESLRSIDIRAVVERAILIHVEGFDWNCRQHITPRYTVKELRKTLEPLQARMERLEVENADLRRRLAGMKKA